MGTVRYILPIWLAFSLVAPRVLGEEPCDDRAPWNRLHVTAARFIEPLPLVLSAGAALAPLTLAPTGADHELRLVAQQDLDGRYDLEPVTPIAPYVVAGGVLVGYVIGEAVGACGPTRTQASMLQAMALATTATLLLKWSVGRGWPNAGGDPRAPDRLEHPEHARAFDPFALRLAAWPSGHTAVLFAAAASLRASTPELGILSWLGYPIAVAVAGGMWLGDHHWASDIVSGVLLGEAIGASAGAAFASQRPRKGTTTTWLVAPWGVRGVAAVATTVW